jgi:uncharacterized membrane protein
MFGAGNIYPIVILDMGQTLFFSLIFVTLMGVLNNNTASPRGVILSTLTNPYIWVSAAALGLKACGGINLIRAVPPLNAVLECFRLLSGVASPVMCLVIGYELKIDLKHIIKPLGVVLLRLLILLPAAALFNELAVVRLLGLEKIFTSAVYTMFILPPFFVGSLLIKDEAVEEKHFAVNVISLNILAFLALFVFMSLRGRI